MAAPPSKGKVTSAFGWRIHPITGLRTLHNGEDTIGDGNFSPVNGTVIFAKFDNSGAGFGNAVAIKEDGTNVVWWLAHHARIDVTVGQKVKQGQRTGLIGKTGAATGVHVHTERRENGNATPRSGIATNPRNFYTAPAGQIGNQMELSSTVRELNVENYGVIDNPEVTIGNRFEWISWWTKRVQMSVDGQRASILTVIRDKVNQIFTKAESIETKVNAISTPTISQAALISALTSPQVIDALKTALLTDIPSKGELTQALTSTVSLVNEHADANKDAIIAALPGGSSGTYNISLNVDGVPGTATGTATPQ